MRFTCSETIKKKKKFVHASLRGRTRHFQNAQSDWELKNKSWIRIFGKHLHEGPKNTRQNENSKFEIYFLTYKPRKKGIFKGASADGFLLLLKNIYHWGLSPLWGILQKCFVKFKMNLLVLASICDKTKVSKVGFVFALALAPARSQAARLGHPVESEKWRGPPHTCL